MLKLVKPLDEAACQRGGALAHVYKALKAALFYPKGHPLRANNLRHAHDSMVHMLNGRELALVINRRGFAKIDGGAEVDGNQMAHALARELFSRRVQRIVFLEDLSLSDLQGLLFLLTIDPRKIVGHGGMESIMARRGIKTVWINETDLFTIRRKRQALESTDTALFTGDEELLFAESQVEPPDPDEIAALSLDLLLERMASEQDDNSYLQLARNLAVKAEEVKGAGAFSDLLPVLEGLLDQSALETKSAIQREYAIFTLEQVAEGKMTDFLLSELENRELREPERVHRVLRQLGEKVAYVIIQRLCIADGLFARKSLATALIKMGSAAVAPLVSMLQDERWYVVRNMVAILGEIGSGECVVAMKATANHYDQRVRKESIRSLVKIGGIGAEAIIIGLLADRDPGIVRQSILSLGIMNSKPAMQPLIEIVADRDLFLGSLDIKKEALQAIGRIGDRRAVAYLLELLESRHFVVWNRWKELKVYAATALGQLGDESALSVLKKKAERGGRLGSVCSEAVDNIERVAVTSNE
jgi:HEAT repeat protein